MTYSAATATHIRSIIAKLGGAEAPLTIGNAKTGHIEPLPENVATIVRQVLMSLAAGRDVTVTETPAEMTPAEAAGYLNVSRPIVMKLIADGTLPTRLVGTHHRIPFADLELYKGQVQARRRIAMDAVYDVDRRHGVVEGPPPPKSSYRGGGRSE